MVAVFGVVVPLSVGVVSIFVAMIFWFFPEAVVISVSVSVRVLLFAAKKRKRLIAQYELSVGRRGRRRQWRERLVA